MRPGATATRTSKTTSRNSNNNSNINSNSNSNNLTVAVMNRTTRTTKFHKRRRRRQRCWQSSSNSNSSTTATTTRARTRRTATAIVTREATTTTTKTASSRYSYPNLSRTGAYLTLLLLTTTCSLCASASETGFITTTNNNNNSSSSSSSSTGSGSGSSVASATSSGAFVLPGSPCAPQHWWDQQHDKCTPCTSCQGEMIPLRPCQLHIDTVCGSIYDLKIDWVVLAKTERNWKERRKSSEYEHFDQASPLQHLSHEQLQQLHEEAAAALPLDWQTAALFIAVLACLLFFSVAACILIHHMRQWRRMERRLDQDVEELSTKLMAKLAEVQSLDGGTFFIGNADALRGLPASAVTAASAAQSGMFQPQHVLLPAKKHAKHQERRILKTLQPGNVYIEENNAVGIGLMPNFKG